MQPANDNHNASLTMLPSATARDVLRAQMAGYRVTKRGPYGHAEGSGNREKMPRRRGQYGHSVHPGGGPDSPAA